MNGLTKTFASLMLPLPLLLSSPAAKAGDKRGLITGIIGVGVGAIIMNEMSKRERKNRANAQRRTRAANAPDSPKVRRNKAIQRSLNQLGYDVGPVDGIPGSRTRAQIANWQIATGNEGTGVLTAEQFHQLTERASPSRSASYPRAEGDQLTEQEVRLLQTSLNRLGYPAGPADGKMGRGTKRALSMFLQDSGNNPETTSLYQALVEATEMAGVEYDRRGRALRESVDQPVTSASASAQSLPEKAKNLSTSTETSLVEEKSSDEIALQGEISELEKAIADLNDQGSE